MKPSQKKLLRTALASIIMSPAKWNQTTWCGTTACLAGHVLAVKGYKMTRSDEGKMVSPSGKKVYVPSEAARLLGLDEDQAEDLFDMRNTIGDLATKVNQLTGAPVAFAEFDGSPVHRLTTLDAAWPNGAPTNPGQ